MFENKKYILETFDFKRLSIGYFLCLSLQGYSTLVRVGGFVVFSLVPPQVSPRVNTLIRDITLIRVIKLDVYFLITHKVSRIVCNLQGYSTFVRVGGGVFFLLRLQLGLIPSKEVYAYRVGGYIFSLLFLYKYT